jgi:pimeloyl-ACP methyl ester carboxylesterase
VSKTVMLIHGAWLTPASWDLFRARYEAQGYTVVAPPWPFLEGAVGELRRAPDPRLARLTIRRIVDHYKRLVGALPEAPIIMGHSYGGLFAQLLLDHGLGAAGVAFAPAPIRGVVPRPRTLLSALPGFTAWNGWGRVLTMSFEQFAANFAQTLPAAGRRAAYERHIVPAPGRLYYQGALGIGTAVAARNPRRAPLLLIAAQEDRIVVPAMVEAACKVQRRAPSATGFKVFPGRSHFLLLEPGWEEVADYALEWADGQARRGVAAPIPADRRRHEH